MTPPLDVLPRQRRRTLLRAVAAAGTAGALQATLAARAAAESIVLEQGDRCVELEPLTGSQPVEDLYDYTYPKDRLGGPPGSQGEVQSSVGTTDLQRERTSILFLYDGPQGLSLVVVHGMLENEGSPGPDEKGGTVTFTMSGLPSGGSWIVRDDYYYDPQEGPETNWARDNWNVDGEPQVVDWAYYGHRTDGGAFRGLGSSFEVTIDPAFNDQATLAADVDYGPLEAWEALSGDREGPERFPLRLDRPVTIRTGQCDHQDDGGGGGGGGGDGGNGGGGNGDDGGNGGGDGDEDDEGEGDRGRRTKHEKKQQKHRNKHQKKQRKHRQKHRKSQRKHRKKQQKHGGKGRKRGSDGRNGNEGQKGGNEGQKGGNEGRKRGKKRRKHGNKE